MSQLQQQKHKKMMNVEFLKDTRAKEPMKLSSRGWLPSDFVDFVCIPLLCQVGKYLLSPKQQNLPHKFWLSKLQDIALGSNGKQFLEKNRTSTINNAIKSYWNFWSHWKSGVRRSNSPPSATSYCSILYPLGTKNPTLFIQVVVSTRPICKRKSLDHLYTSISAVFLGMVRHGKLKHPWIWASQTSKRQGTLQNAVFDHVPKVDVWRSPLNCTMNAQNCLTLKKEGKKRNPVILQPPNPHDPEKKTESHLSTLHALQPSIKSQRQRGF